jgi:hypothetical protein
MSKTGWIRSIIDTQRSMEAVRRVFARRKLLEKGLSIFMRQAFPHLIGALREIVVGYCGVELEGTEGQPIEDTEGQPIVYRLKEIIDRQTRELTLLKIAAAENTDPESIPIQPN